MMCVAAGADPLGQSGKLTVESVATFVWN